MKIELWKISDIKPYPGNPRLNDSAIEAVAASLREFGFRQPIVVDENGVIIVGHTRWKAAQKLGLEKVPVHVAKDLLPAQIKAYRIADNQTATIAEWDFDLLPIELAELQNLDFDLGLLGFDQDELAKILQSEAQDGLCDPDEIPAPPDEATTQPATCGSSIITGSCVVIRVSPRNSIVCLAAKRFTWSTRIRRTTSRSSPAATTPSPRV